MNRFGIKLIYNKYNSLNKKGEAPIYVEVYLNGLQYYYNTSYYIIPEHWDKNERKVKRSHPNYRALNTNLSKLRLRMEEIVLEYDNRQEKMSFQALKSELRPKEAPKSILPFSQFFRDEIKKRNDVNADTRQNHLNTLEKLLDFYESSVIHFEDLTYNLIQNFEYYLTSNGLQPNSRRKQHNILQAYINRAIKQDLLSVDSNPYKKFKKPKAETNRTALTKEELQKIIDLEFEPELKYMYVVKDIFLFSCATALRFSDVMRLTWDNIYYEEDKIFLKMKMQKTGRWVDLPLNLLSHSQLALSILEKYRKEGHNLVFPRLSLGYVNRVLKDISQLAGINRTVTSHIARHTFGTLGASKLPTLVLRELMGHSKVDTTMRYVKMSRKQIIDDLKNIKWDE